MAKRRIASLLAVTALGAAQHCLCASAVLDPNAPNSMTLFTLGSIPSINAQYTNDYSYEGIAITVNNLFLAVGNAANSVQTIWSLPVIRSNGHITGFGNPTAYAQVLAADPNTFGNVMAGGLLATNGGLLYTTQAYTFLGQYVALNNTSTVLDVTSTGGFAGGLQYVPAGFSGAGQLKMSSITGTWYTLNLAGTMGNYTLSSYAQYDPGVSAYSFDYIPADATFGHASIVLGDAGTQRIDAYALDANGNPCSNCAPVVHLVTSNLGVGYGIARDPVTGDILFTTQSNDLWRLSDTLVVPEPGTVALVVLGLVAMRRQRSALSWSLTCDRRTAARESGRPGYPLGRLPHH